MAQLVVSTTLGKLDQEDQAPVPAGRQCGLHSEFQARLGYRVGPCFQKLLICLFVD